MSQRKAEKIWIDLDNSPHVPFFAPLISELQRRGHAVILTARDCFQVCGLAEMYGMNYRRIGKHYGKNKVVKVAGTVYRSLQLLGLARNNSISLALSHGSRSQVLASKMAGINSAVVTDYEHVAGFKVFRADVFIVPELIADVMAKKVGRDRMRTYPGIKEDVYIRDFTPDARILEALKIKPADILVTIRPPATEAHYYNPESLALFIEAVEFLGLKEKMQMVLLPRNEKKQGDFIRSRWGQWCDERRIIIPENVVNGLNLIWYSDLVISGGGTMNREAAALGVPVYSIFRGKIGAVDRYLSEKGRLVLIENKDQLYSKIVLARRDKPKNTGISNNQCLHRIVSHIVDIVEGQSA